MARENKSSFYETLREGFFIQAKVLPAPTADNKTMEIILTKNGSVGVVQFNLADNIDEVLALAKEACEKEKVCH